MRSVINPFRMLIVMATVLAIAMAAWFVLVVFVQHPTLETLGTIAVIETV